MTTNSPPVIEALKLSSKGRLRYDRNCFINEKAIEVMLDTCTSSPVLSEKVPQILQKIETSLHCDCETSGSHLLFNSSDDPTFKSTPKIKRFERNKHELPESEKNGINSKVQNFPKNVSSSPNLIDRNIKDYENFYEGCVVDAVKAKRNEFKKSSQQIQKHSEERYKQWQLQQELENMKRLHQLEAEEHQWEEQLNKKRIQLKEHGKQHALQLHAKLKEAEAKQKEKIEEDRRKHQEAQKRLQTMIQTLLDCKKAKEETQLLLEKCPHKEFLPPNAQKAIDSLNTLNIKLEQTVASAKGTGITEEHMQRIAQLRKTVITAREGVARAVSAATKKGKDAENLEKQRKQNEEEEKRRAEQEKKNKAAAVTEPSRPEDVAALAKADVVLCVTEACLIHYDKIMNVLKAYEGPVSDFTNNSELKKYRFELQKAVNTHINSIASLSGSHLRDKLKKLVFILAGQAIELKNGKKLSATEHPDGLTFVRDMFAKKIVKQGEEQVSSNFESAFAIAGVVVGVWSMLPAVGDLLLGYFYSSCPYLVPYYIPKQDGQSRESYYKSQGYMFENGQVEDQDKFLKRMSGMMRLFASILITLPPDSASSNQPHPHGVEQAWAWLINTINLEPRPSITATMMFDFLQITGYTLNKTYQKQFHKVLNAIVLDYLPKVRKVTPEGAAGPVSRLEICLQKWLNSGHIPQPDGVLQPNFWYT